MAGSKTSEFGVRIRELRMRRGLTQAQLAGTDFSAAYISRIESGSRIPSQRALAILARRLGVSPSDLVVEASDWIELEALRVGFQREFSRGHLDDAAELSTRWLTRSEELGNATHVTAALLAVGEVLEARGSVHEARRNYERALGLSEAIDLEQRLLVLSHLGRAWRMAGEVEKAIDILQQGLRELEPFAEAYPREMARFHMGIAAALAEAGDHAPAATHGQEALQWARQAEDRRTLADALWTAGGTLEESNAKEALRLLRKASTVYAELGLDHDLARLSQTLSQVARKAGDRAAARAAIEHTLALIRDSNSPSDEGVAFYELAELDHLDGQLDSAIANCRRAIARLEHVDEPWIRGRAQLLLAQLLTSTHPDEAEASFRDAARFFGDASNPTERARALGRLADLLASQGRTDEALTTYKASIESIDVA